MTLSFIETQFPVSKVSKESYKERMANYSQTLTGLGKWWGRKPLILVRATLLGLLMPAGKNPDRDREIFLKILTMDENGLWNRYKSSGKKISAKDIYLFLMQIDEEHEKRVHRKAEKFKSFLPGLEVHLFSSPKSFLSLFFTEKNGKISWKKDTEEKDREFLERFYFESLFYDEKLRDYCARPEQTDGPAAEDWKEINEHLGTEVNSLPELFQELGKKRFGHIPRVGDAFCGGGSIPFEAARMGCEVYASDLNPVAALLTWAALNIVGGGEKVAEEVRKAQEEIYSAVDRQVTEWGIEHNEKGHRADAYLYCVEAEDPETGWMVPLAPSWVIGEKTKTVAVLIPDENKKRYDIKIQMGASDAEMKKAKEGTVKNNYVIHPMNPNPIPMSLIRRENKGGLRLWEKEDIAPRKEDVFQERLYCIRYVETYYMRFEPESKDWIIISKKEAESMSDFTKLLASKKIKEGERRYYTAPSPEDIKREERTLELLQERFSEWQEKGYIPSRKIEEGDKTSEPIRTRGWCYWHQLFNARQLLVNGLFMEKGFEKYDTKYNIIFLILAIGRTSNWDSKLNVWDPHHTRELNVQVFLNQALNTLYNYGTRSLSSRGASIILKFESILFVGKNSVFTDDARIFEIQNDIWITDPPYADAVMYHELTEFFLAWYEKHIPKLFPEWYSDSKRALAIKGQDSGFRKSMVDAYSNLAKNMPDEGMQVVMFTHQDAGVWADLALILWASGLKVTSAWTIATETTSELKKGNYVQGTVLLVLRKNSSEETVFLDELVPLIEDEVKMQIDSMQKLEDREEPNFGDTDYQLAAYAAALRILTNYKKIGDIDVMKELMRTGAKGEKNPLEELIENAKAVASSYLLPYGMEKTVWADLSGEERFYLKGLDLESKGESRSGSYQELAKGYGIRDYAELLSSAKANEVRLKTPQEFAGRLLRTEGFGSSLLRNVLYAVYTANDSESPKGGVDWLKNEVPDFWSQKSRVISLLKYLSRFEHSLKHWKQDASMSALIAGSLESIG